MYVRCPVDNETEVIHESRTYFLGQVSEVNEETGVVMVNFYDPLNLRSFFTTIPENKVYHEKYVPRATALENSIVMFKGRRVKLLCVSKNDDKEKYDTYFIEYFKDGKATVGEVSENQIEIPFTRANFNPARQMLRYELQNPSWYISRRIVSKSLNVIANAPYGFKNLLGTRVHLFTHQVDTIVRALAENPCRLMLADEVGLGKTIEALAIIKGMVDKRPNLRSLIIVPETLIYQWQTEISFKFWQNAPIWGVDKISDTQMMLVSSNNLSRDYEKIVKLCKWDMCVVDETHKLLSNDALFSAVLKLCKATDNLLLLSATPILHREQEYGKLLTLLNPLRFENMPLSIFNALLSKQKSIQDIVYNLMRDLSDYIQYSLHDDFIDRLQQINDEINDDKLMELISSIDASADDMGLSQVKLALSYIAEFYQIERGIIRHRRAEIISADVKRQLIDISYEMVGSDIGFYEENCYNAVIDLAGDLCNNVVDNGIDLVKKLVSAVTSTPYALLDVIAQNKPYLEIFDTEKVVSFAKKWQQAYDNEITRISEVSNDIDNFYSKFSKIIDYIDQEDVNSDKKFLVFTGFTATVEKLEQCFKQFFGNESTCTFHSGKSPEEMQDSATLFQNDESCRFMVCDESGGEGRNFQVADYIIHCDLPWSPSTLEQRIGRLDRIGRKSGLDVISVVIHSQSSLEDNLFDIYDKGLNIFKQSLCGMEIAFEQIHNTIETALKNDVRFGLADVILEISNFANQMNEEIEKERYYDLARQLDIDLQGKLNKLIAHFTDNDGEELMNTMLAWPHMAGFTGISVTNAFKDGSKVVSFDTTKLSERSMENTLYFPPRMDEIIRRSKYKNDIRGTFSRTAAVKHENLTFFAPFNPLFDSITTNAEECYKGRSVAFKYVGCQLEWAGLVQTWSIKYNPIMLYKKGFTPDLITLISRYLPSEQILFANSINSKHEGVDSIEIVDQIECFGRKKPIHLGKRNNGAIDNFKKHFPVEKWQSFIKSSYSKGRRYATEQTRLFTETENARKELERILTANNARELFYGYKDENALLKGNDEIEALMYGLENPIIELDSIAFVMLDK